MKWPLLASLIVLITGCATTEVVEYRQVGVVGVVPVQTTVTRVITPEVIPAVEPVVVDYVEPIDVTTTMINIY